MSKKEFFAIGHITNDTLPKSHVGGGVSYTAFAAKRLGYEAHIITKAPEDSQFVRELQALGIIVHCLPIVDGANAEKVTAFANVNDAIGRRTQYVSQVQENIGMEDLPQFPNIPDSALVMVAPVIGEVTPEALVALGRQRQIAVTPQGYYRVAEADGSVRRADWKDAEVLRHSWLSVLSNEDLSFGYPPQLNISVREKLQSLAPLLAVTNGENGSELSLAGRKNRIHIEALSLKREELRDFTGAGDTYAFAFLSKFAETRDAVDAGVFASLFAALKIADIAEGGNGLATVPNEDQVRKFLRTNPKRTKDFFASNASTEQKLFQMMKNT